MAKIISYQFAVGENSQGEQILQEKNLVCPTQSAYDANYPIAEKEAYQGKIDVEGEFDIEPMSEPTADEILNAMLGVNRYA